MSYPTQEDELRAKEAAAQENCRSAESSFLASFQTVPQANAASLAEMAHAIVQDFNSIVTDARNEPYERQENLMAGLKKLLQGEIDVIEARRAYTGKIRPTKDSAFVD